MTKSILTIKIAGDSGDGVQLTGNRLAMIEVLFGSEVVTVADFPAEIRAPKGTIYGVSSYQMQIGGQQIYTAGDQLDILAAFNPAALKVCLPQLKKSGLVIVDSDSFTDKNLKNVGYQNDILDNQSTMLKDFQLLSIPIYQQLSSTLLDKGYAKKDIMLAKNFFVLGVISWLLGRPIDNTIKWIKSNFAHLPKMVSINCAAINEGYTCALVRELIFQPIYHHPDCEVDCDVNLRFISGNHGLALGIITATRKAKLPLFFSSYPITPASDILHIFTSFNQPDIKVFQAEDEIASVCSAIGASFGKNLGVVATSGPGMSLMTEGINLAVMAELPLVVINVQRAGPSTGMPTKSEQADLYQAIFGRHGESPVVVLAAKSSSNCFDVAYLACKIAIERTCVVIVLSDARLAYGFEVWKVVDIDDLVSIDYDYNYDPDNFEIYARNPKTYARPWIGPGNPGFEHIIGGLEKTPKGVISYDGNNHQLMVNNRSKKIQLCADIIPKLELSGHAQAKTLIIGWGSTYGAISQFIVGHNNHHKKNKNKMLAQIHLLSISPFASNLAQLIKKFNKLLVVEENSGQLFKILIGNFCNKNFISIAKNDAKAWTPYTLSKKITDKL